MMLLTTEEIVLMHDCLIAKTGGAHGLRDANLLESAVWSVNAGYEDFEQYPSIEEKAARLAFALVENHAFIDGNKRIGLLAMLTTLKENDVELQCTDLELVELGLSIANGTSKYDEILRWILSHRRGE